MQTTPKKARILLLCGKVIECGNANTFMHAIMKEFVDNQDIALCNKQHKNTRIKKIGSLRHNKRYKRKHCNTCGKNKTKGMFNKQSIKIFNIFPPCK